MKAFYVMLVVSVVLLFAAPVASAQDSWLACPGGSAYDLTGHGCVTGYLNGPAATEPIAPKAAGLAKLAPAVTPEQGLPCLSWGNTYDQMTHDNIQECLSWPAANAAAPKPVGLAAPAPAREQFVPCSFGEGLDPLLDPLALACLTQSVPAANAASKPAGLAQPAPAPAREQFVPCSFGEGLDPLLDPLALACLTQSVPAAKAASKPAGLAAPAPAQAQFGPCPAGESPDPLLLVCLH